eukprot:gene11810-3098_t
MRFVNITGRSENGGLLSGLQGSGITNISFENVHIKFETWSNYSSGPLPCYASGPVCTNETDPKCVPSPIAPDTEMLCPGSRDYRPMPSSGVPCPDCYATRSPGVADGIYVENGHDIYFENVTFEYELPRKAWFGDCLSTDNLTTGLHGANHIKCTNGLSSSESPSLE